MLKISECSDISLLHSVKYKADQLLKSVSFRAVIDEAAKALRNAAGNYYVNDKSTGSIVAQQPFGGARASGKTNHHHPRLKK